MSNLREMAHNYLCQRRQEKVEFIALTVGDMRKAYPQDDRYINNALMDYDYETSKDGETTLPHSKLRIVAAVLDGEIIQLCACESDTESIEQAENFVMSIAFNEIATQEQRRMDSMDKQEQIKHACAYFAAALT